jgi:uncharacterized protein
VQFEWDDVKAASNLAKHEVDFDDALRVFLDPRRLVAEDERRDYGERRLRVLGGVCRLISARKANARERRRYHAGDP